jgi:pimeloyl-ACP methyl ester carboxylesterase
MVIQSYLNRHPDAARGAVIGGPLQSMAGMDFPDSVKQMFSPLPLLNGVLTSVGPKTTYKTLLDSVNAANGGQWLTLADAVRAQAMTAFDSFTTAEFRKVFRAVYNYVPPTLSHVSTPTLVLYGDHEMPLVKRQGERLARTVMTGSHQEIARSGHLVNQDQPKAFNDACAAFFDTLDWSDTEVAAE